ncbi:MAG: DUF2892 domain-containing protein [Bacteroidota bacterium]
MRLIIASGVSIPEICSMRFKGKEINMGSADRIARMFSAIMLISLYALGVFTIWYGVTALVAAIFLMTTSLIGTCPLYSIIKVSSCPVDEPGHNNFY